MPLSKRRIPECSLICSSRPIDSAEMIGYARFAPSLLTYAPPRALLALGRRKVRRGDKTLAMTPRPSAGTRPDKKYCADGSETGTLPNSGFPGHHTRQP